ncbi:MAG: hypothetical protein HEEMFOPI_01626 [Holosporales bacterium]
MHEFYKKNKIKPYSQKQQERYINSAKYIFEQRFYNNVLSNMDEKTLNEIELLFQDGTLFLDLKKYFKGCRSREWKI